MPIAAFDSAIVEMVDPTLTFVADLYPEATRSWTVLVEREGVPYVLKVRRKGHNMWDERYFHCEISALRRAAERELEGVTRLCTVYENDSYHALLKDYAEGTPGNRLDPEELLYNPEVVRKLDALFLRLHLAGIAKFCFEPRKIVVEEDQKLVLVDLSTCVVNTEVGVLLFSQAMRDDGAFITQLEKRIRRRATGNRSLLSRIWFSA